MNAIPKQEFLVIAKDQSLSSVYGKVYLATETTNAQHDLSLLRINHHPFYDDWEVYKVTMEVLSQITTQNTIT